MNSIDVIIDKLNIIYDKEIDEEIKLALDNAMDIISDSIKHYGEWEYKPVGTKGAVMPTCSICAHSLETPIERYYCPNCGAKME